MCSPLILLTLAVLSFANTSITKIISADEYTIEADSEKHVIDLCSYKRCTFVKKVTSKFFLMRCPIGRQGSTFETSKRKDRSLNKGNDIIQIIPEKFKDTIKKIEFQNLHRIYPRSTDLKWIATRNLNGQVLPSIKVKEI